MLTHPEPNASNSLDASAEEELTTAPDGVPRPVKVIGGVRPRVTVATSLPTAVLLRQVCVSGWDGT